MTVDFNDYFWGDKNNGFEVLYHNMKHGLLASKELGEYFRERSNLEEHNSKVLLKLANKAGTGSPNGTFSPLWVAIKSTAESLSVAHAETMAKLSELVKTVVKYAEELHKKHKTVKEEESGTQDAVHAMKDSSIAVQKAKDVYHTRLAETEKLKKEGCSAKELEKAEAKLKKTQDEYKALVEKHNPIKAEFERRMTATCKRFQNIEETHLTDMKEFVKTYFEIMQYSFEMVQLAYNDFERQFSEMTVDKLLEQFVLNKYTGLEKPETIEVDLVNLSSINEANDALNKNSSIPLGPIINLNSSENNNGRPVSPNFSNLSHLSQPAKKESNLRSWFHLPGRATPAPHDVTITSIHNNSEMPSSVTNTNNSDDTFNDDTNSPTQSMKTSGSNKKSSNFGESFYNFNNTKQNKLKEQGSPVPSTSSTPSSNVVVVPNTSKNVNKIEQQQQQDQQTKSSRRTTSLLNLFMSNSQGKHESNRDLSSIRTGYSSSLNQSEVLSAPSSPSQFNEHSRPDHNNTNIGRNPLLRGSKFSGFLRSRREKAKSKKNKKGKKDPETNSTKDTKLSDGEEKDESNKAESSNTPVSKQNLSNSNAAPTASPEIDDDGFSVKPDEVSWPASNENSKKDKAFYSSSDSESEEEPERKIHVEIKPLNNGTAPISASVDELRATVEQMSLSPLGALSRGSNYETDYMQMKRSKSMSQHLSTNKPSGDLLGLTIFQQQSQQSPVPSNSSTPTAGHPYAPLQSPTFSMSNNSTNRYADLGDLFSEVGDISNSAPASATLSRAPNHRSTPTSANSTTSSIAIPRPPSRRSETAIRGRISPASMSRADSVGSLEFRTASIIGTSRGPSPLTIGMTDTIPLAVAFHEIIHAYFRGSDETRCQVKMSGDMMLSFPAGIVNVLANNPNPAKLLFRLKNVQNLDTILPNKQIISIDKLQSNTLSATIEFNMPALTALLRRQSEQNPTASYFNVDILKYQIKAKPGASSCPFQLVSYWKCETTHTDLKIDYKYNSHAMASPSPLLNVSINVPVDGGVKNVQSKPHSAWLGESNRLVWNFTDISQHSDNSGVDTLRARLEVANGPSNPAILNTQFNCEGTTLSGIEFELAGSGYRLSLVKRRFVSGKYICEGDGIRSMKSPTPTSSVNSPSPNSRPT
uniref:CSON011071 protein n=1 Tax=Culicoides sonorensis TaxID=179676 RepID=A0A336LYW5_CULSO